MSRVALTLLALALVACTPRQPPAAESPAPASASAETASATSTPAPKPAQPISPPMADGESDDPNAIPPVALEPIRADLGKDMGEVHYFGRTVDLGGDARSEAVVQVAGPNVCGSGGCTTYVLAQDDTGKWSIVSKLSVTQAPIAATNTRTHGWRDLLVAVGGGGGESGFANVTFDGKAYASNPTTVPGPLAKSLPPDVEILVPRFDSLAEGPLLP